MTDFVRSILDASGAWGGKGVIEHEPPSLEEDWEARVIALLIERAGGDHFTLAEIRDAPNRLLLLPLETEEGLRLEVRRLSSSGR